MDQLFTVVVVIHNSFEIVGRLVNSTGLECCRAAVRNERREQTITVSKDAAMNLWMSCRITIIKGVKEIGEWKNGGWIPRNGWSMSLIKEKKKRKKKRLVYLYPSVLTIEKNVIRMFFNIEFLIVFNALN